MKINNQHFILSILFFLILPLFPMFLDALWNNGAIRERSLTLATSIFTITKGISSKEPLVFGLSIILGIFLIGTYGLISPDVEINSFTSLITKHQTLIIIAVVFSQSCERYTMHILNNQPFFEFKKEE